MLKNNRYKGIKMYFELFGSLFLISLISVIGIFSIRLKNTTLEKWVEGLVAFAIGALIGDVFIHLLPEITEGGMTPEISFAILAGIVIFFLLEKVIHWQHCHHTTHGKTCHRFTYMSLMGDIFHNFIDGVIMAGAFMANPIIGFSTTIAVILHEIPQEMGDYAVLIKGGFSQRKALAYNFLSSLTSFAGAILTIFFSTIITGITPLLIAFAAGSFLYIAGTDLFPELHKEFSVKKAIIQIFFIMLGIAIMSLLLLVE